MGGVAGGKLAAAVSGAGGLGMIGVGSAGSPKTVETEARHPSEAGVNFGIGLIDWLSEPTLRCWRWRSPPSR
jgi:nitronate monooxygenase